MNYYGNNLRNNYNMSNMNAMNTWSDPTQQLGFVGVQNENEARAFPVALGNSVTFRDESQPNTFYTKTMGNSPLERPIFEKYRLVKEDAAVSAPDASETASSIKDIDLSIYASKDDLKAFEGQIVEIRKELAALKPKRKVIREVEVEDDEYYRGHGVNGPADPSGSRRDALEAFQPAAEPPEGSERDHPVSAELRAGLAGAGEQCDAAEKSIFQKIKINICRF